MRFKFIDTGRLAITLALALFTTATPAQTSQPPAVNDQHQSLDHLPQLAQADQPTAAKEATTLSTDQIDANIAFVTADLVEKWQFSQHPFDAEISSKFLDRYLEALDYEHTFFLHSDLQEFETYRTNLQVYTLQKHDISPAHVIFSRFLERAREREAYQTNLLATESFEFTNHDRFTPDRHLLPNPKDMDEATNLWREEVRYEYLDEKLREKLAFSGPVALEPPSKMVIKLTRKGTNSEDSFDHLPGKFLDRQGREIGSLDQADHGSNAVVHLAIASGDNLLKITNEFFSSDGASLGSISFQRAPEVVLATNQEGALKDGAAAINPAADTNGRSNIAAKSSASTTNYEGVIRLNAKDPVEIVRTLNRRFVQVLKNYNDLTQDGHVLELYLTALARAYDPHSDYFGRAQAENFGIQMSLSFVGIGAELHKTESDTCEISRLLPNGPAEKSGLITNGDIITAVAQKDQEPVPVNGMPLQEVVDMIRGPKGTPVTLTLELAHPRDPSVRQRTLTLVRDKVNLVDKEAKAELYDSTPRIGVIDVPSFYAAMDTHPPDMMSGRGLAPQEDKSVTSDVAKLVARLKKEHVRGIILDFRANGGGYLDQAIKLTGLFIGKGPVVQEKTPDGNINTDSSLLPRPLYDGPLIVLTSRMSASASEILAGALQDYGRALIVGDKATYGKGTVQTVQPLASYMEDQHLPTGPDLGSLHVTIKKFYRASGLTTESNGVAADIVLPSILNYANFSESSQPNWLPADEVPSDDPPNFNMVNPYLPELLKRSLQRRAKSEDFAYIQEDIDHYRKTLDDKSVSMNEAERVAEQHAIEARMEARKKERASRPKSTESFYDLTMENVDKPELKPHTDKAAPAANDDPDAIDEEAPPDDPDVTDPIMAEARHIMADYISLMNKPLAASTEGQ